MIAISVTDKKLTASMDIRFGRSPFFLITDGVFQQFVYNPYWEKDDQVATKVVDLLVELSVTKVVTGEVGPNAKALLEAKKIQIILLTDEKINLLHILKRMNLLQ